MKRQIHLRLIHDDVPAGSSSDASVRFGLQDGKGEVHPCLAQHGEPQNLDFVLEIHEGGERDGPIFQGAFAHGLPKSRFVCLSWMRQGRHEHPWDGRLKIPLSGIGWVEIRAAEKPGKCLTADITGRHPHGSETIEWRVAALRPKCDQSFPLICVGGSAGGLDAYKRLLRNLPPDLGVAVVIVNHLRTAATLLHEILPQLYEDACQTHHRKPTHQARLRVHHPNAA